MRTTLLLVTVLLAFAGNDPDTVRFVDKAKELHGRVVYEGLDEIVLRQGSRDQRIPRRDIAEIRSLERSLAPILARDLSKADSEALAVVAKQCDDALLEEEGHNLWLRVLLADPRNDEALKAVGGRRIKDAVQVKFGKEQKMLADMTKKQDGWNDAYPVETTHFLLESDLPLPEVFDLGGAVERFFERFYKTLGAPLELYVFDEKPVVEFYSSAKDFPVPPVKGDKVWFAPGINQIHVLVEAEPDIRAIVNQMSRLMMFNALRRSAGTTAQVPQWTLAGVGEIFALAAPEVRGGPWADLAQIDVREFALTKSAKVDFDRVFNGSSNDFNLDAKRTEMTAAAYTLVHWLVFSNDGALREKLGKYLREGAKGKLSMGSFTDALGMDKKEIESAWSDYVFTHAK